MLGNPHLMNQALSSILRKQLLLISLLLLLSLIIIFIGPLLQIYTIAPLQTWEERFYTIFFIWLLWFLKFIFMDTKPHKKIFPFDTNLQKKIERLQGQFQGALNFLKKTAIQKQHASISLMHLPWFLMIGPKSSGKTTLLTNTNINFILAKQQKSKKNRKISSDLPDWWATRDIVIVDVPGDYLLSQSKHAPTRSLIFHHLWQELLSLIQKNKKDNLHGIILTLNLPEIIRQKKLEKKILIADIKKRIQELLDIFGKDLPIHLVITKCDLTPGFNEFFSESSMDEISSAWGITIPHHVKENLTEVFSHRFNALIKRLNNQLIPRLHQERNALTRSYIKDFPLHIEQLKEHISQFLKAIHLPHLSLVSVHLVSGTQEYLSKASRETFFLSNENSSTQSLQILTAPPPEKRSFFVKQLLLQTLQIATPVMESKILIKETANRRIAYAVSFSVILIASFYLVHDFSQGAERVHAIQNNLLQYQLTLKNNPEGSHLTKDTLTLLNALYETSSAAEKNLTLAFFSNKSYETSKEIYHEALQTIVIPEIKKYFEQYLETRDPKKLDAIYPILKAYLMLGDKEHYDPAFIANTLKPLVPASTQSEDLIALSRHIKAALHESFIAVSLDVPLILRIRKELYHLRKSELAFLLLKNIDDNNRDKSIELGTNQTKPSVFISNGTSTEIPAMYTGKKFQKILSDEINEVSNDVFRGNWILGNNPDTYQDADIETLKSEVRSQYIAKYVDIWESLLANIQFTSTKNLADLDTMLGILTGQQSPLLQLLNTIKDNTTFSPILMKSPSLQTLGILLIDANSHEGSALYEIFVSLKELHTYLQNILNSPHPDQALFEATKKRMQMGDENDTLRRLTKTANTAPVPLKSWLTALTNSTWQHMLLETSQYIENAYQDEVVHPYHAAIQNRYPFNPTAIVDVDLGSFTDFFGNPGQLTHFYQTYLKPFVKDSEDNWTYVNVDNQQIPFGNAILEQIQHGILLQRAFFPNGDNKLYVAFSLQPLELDEKMKGFTLNINGQEIRYEKNASVSPRTLSWPGNNKMHGTYLNFVSSRNQLTSRSYQGNWGWFKLVNTATVEVHSPKEMLLHFNVSGRTAKYLLFTQGKVNPFLPITLTRFVLPEHLT